MHVLQEGLGVERSRVRMFNLLRHVTQQLCIDVILEGAGTLATEVQK